MDVDVIAGVIKSANIDNAIIDVFITNFIIAHPYTSSTA